MLKSGLLDQARAENLLVLENLRGTINRAEVLTSSNKTFLNKFLDYLLKWVWSDFLFGEKLKYNYFYYSRNKLEFWCFYERQDLAFKEDHFAIDLLNNKIFVFKELNGISLGSSYDEKVKKVDINIHQMENFIKEVYGNKKLFNFYYRIKGT